MDRSSPSEVDDLTDHQLIQRGLNVISELERRKTVRPEEATGRRSVFLVIRARLLQEVQ